jgi:CHAT domain-containing protein
VSANIAYYSDGRTEGSTTCPLRAAVQTIPASGVLSMIQICRLLLLLSSTFALVGNALGETELRYLREALQIHEHAKLAFDNKHEYERYQANPDRFLTHTGADAPILVERIADRLNEISFPDAEAGALVFAARHVFLLSRRGVEAAAPLPQLDKETIFGTRGISGALHAGLRVETREASRVPVEKGARSKKKKKEASSAPLPEADVPSADVALKMAADLMIPAEIRERLARGDLDRLLILPTSDGGIVPFAALPIGNRNLIDLTIPIILADVEQLFKAQQPEFYLNAGAKIIIGDPDLSGDKTWRFSPLPGAREEALEVARLLHTTAAVGSAATKDFLRGRLSADQNILSLIYLATHGIADPVNPMDGSFLALKDAHFFAREIKRLRFPHRPLVVMSACQSGLGKVFPGGIFGLARAWHYAGASRVVMSLWNVSDEATRYLMVSFLGSVASGYSAERALRLAMIATRQFYPDPALWAAFTIFGTPTKLSAEENKLFR